MKAIGGATLLDGNGGEPVADAVVLVDGERIVACGPSLEIPADAEVTDATGKFLIPGLIDTNVHLAPFWHVEELIRYHDRFADVALETAQLMLRAGVTTVRDTYGPLLPLLATRDAIARGDAVGPRVLVAGNIVGWGGPASITFAPNPYLAGAATMDLRGSYLMETIQDEFTQGVGEELVELEPDALRSAINRYLDTGIDLLKFGGTSHLDTPSMILFSPRAQEMLVEESHRRGLAVDVHSTSPEGLRISLLAGIDVVQHPELHWAEAPMSDELAELHASLDVVCSMNVPYWTGRVWREYLEQLEESERPTIDRALTGTERRTLNARRYRRTWRANAEKLIAAGCTISTASDSCALFPPALRRGTERYLDVFPHRPGPGTLDAVEGLVEMGLEPDRALVCATKHGALACKALDDYGTIEAGKSADLLVLDGDPLADIRNVRRQSMVLCRGQVVDVGSLPSVPVYSAEAP